MFRPFVGEVLIAKLKTCDKSGLYCMFPFPISVMINAAFPMIIRVVPFLFKGFCMDVASVFYSFRTSQHSQNWVFLKTGGSTSHKPSNLSQFSPPNMCFYGIPSLLFMLPSFWLGFWNWVVQCLWAAFLMTFIFQSICCSNLQHCNTFTPSLCLGWALGS